MTLAGERPAKRYPAPLLLAAALFVAAGGFVHLREWLETYLQVPASAPGAAVVRIGFPVNAAASLVISVGLVLCAARRSRFALPTIAVAIVFQAGSLAALIITRTGNLFGWAEPTWTLGADQSRAVEVGALISLCAALAMGVLQRRSEQRDDLTNPVDRRSVAA